MFSGQTSVSPSSSTVADRPTIIPWKDAWQQIADLRAKGEIHEFVDGFEPSLPELVALERPGLELKDRARYINELRASLIASSVVVVLPWRRCAVHLPDAETFHRIRMMHNRAAHSSDESAKQRSAIAAVAGLGLGFEIIENLVLGGGPRRLRIADMDRLSLTHLNRAAHSICDVGMRKTRLTSRRVFELDPFADVAAFNQIMDAETMTDLLTPNGRPVDIFIEELEYVPMKLLARQVARELRIPVITVSDLGNSAVVDVERFDLDTDRPLTVAATEAATPLLRSSDSARLATATSLAGASGAYVARRIIAGVEMPSGRYSLSLDAVFNSSSRPTETAEHPVADYAA